MGQYISQQSKEEKVQYIYLPGVYGSLDPLPSFQKETKLLADVMDVSLRLTLLQYTVCTVLYVSVPPFVQQCFGAILSRRFLLSFS
jgi:hypothetical protein